MNSATAALRSGSVWIGGADFDRRIPFQTALKFPDDLYNWVGNPGVLGTDIALLFQIGEQVDDLRQWQLLWRRVHVFLPNQMCFPIAPLNGGKPVGNVSGESFTVGGFLFAEEKIQLVHAIDRPIFRNFGSADAREGRIQVDDMNDLVVNATRWHLAWPANDERCA